MPGAPSPPPVKARAGTGGVPGGNGRRRWLVRVLRVALPVMAALLIAGAILWSELFPTGTRLGVQVAVVEPEQGEEEAMHDAVYSGVDSRGRPFTLTAERVRSDPAQAHILKLQKPGGRIEMVDGKIVTIAAREGIYNRDEDVLDLEGDVTLRHGEGMTTNTSHARIDLDGGTAAGDEPVAGEASFGTIRGVGFRISQQGDVISVGGPAYMTISEAPRP
jgi:lipopolysaccharide export system protein LptC